MADNIWISSGSTDATVGANWSLGAAPVATDDVFFTDASVVSVETGPVSGIDYNSVNVHEDYIGTIMSSGTKFLLGTVGNLRFASRGGRGFFEVTPADVLAEALVTTTRGITGMLELDAQATGAITAVKCVGTSGGVTISGGAAGVANIDVSNCPGLTLNIGASVTGLSQLRMDSGLVLNASVFTTGSGIVRVMGGTFRHEFTGTGADISDLQIIGYARPAIFEDRVGGTGGACTMALMYATGVNARFDGRLCTKPTRTITASTAWNMAEVFWRNSLKSYAGNTIEGHGARVDVEIAETQTAV